MRRDWLLRHQAVLGVASEAGEAAMRLFGDRSSLAVSLKGRQDWLTEADGIVEKLIVRRLGELFPGDAVFGEEGGGRRARTSWIIDPIDGTANFARGDRNWCISIGYVAEGEPVVGIIHAPALGETFRALAGSGATLNDRPIKVAETGSIAAASVEMGWSTRLPHADYLAMVARAFEAGAAVKRSASGALGLAHVACGRTDAYAELHINAWDVAAGIVIAREAGASVSDFFAGDGLENGNPILCTTPHLAAELSRLTGIAIAARRSG